MGWGNCYWCKGSTWGRQRVKMWLFNTCLLGSCREYAGTKLVEA